jgi:protein-S-isoprenylcysteine O-methyltransferase Ste14
MKTNFEITFWKFIYGFAFVVVLPILLILWARATGEYVLLPMIASAQYGVAILLIGLLLMFMGVAAIILYGGGYPMNAFPPKQFVFQGIYRLVPHPIYLGFCLCCVGTAIMLGSRSGFWLISPIVILGCVALVEGFEKQDMKERWGAHAVISMIHLPTGEERPPSNSERVSVYLLVLLPWLIIYETVLSLGIPSDAIVAYLSFEKRLPVLEWTEIFYAGTYILVAAVPVFAKPARILREFSISGLLGTGCIILFFIVIPLIAPQRGFIPGGELGRILEWERGYDGAAAAFPSFHVFWAILAASAFARTYPSIRKLWYALAVLISLSCITTGMHAVIDVVSGGVVGWMCLRYKAMWERLRSATERIANSWKEWHIGSVRIINHGVYPGVGTFLGLSLVGTLAGQGSMGYVLIIAFSSLVTAGLWAQFVEGSPALLRPYGYYGGVIGVIIGGLFVYILDGDAWLLLAAFSVAGPIIQASGRLRCLVQGCCHGRPAPGFIGIRYIHPMSRVCRLAKLDNVPIHPTPLYSILWNIVIGIVLARLWFLGAAPNLISGLYLILNGLGRFVEEAYRGEPQTPIVGPLRLYQLMALLSILVGAVLTTVSSHPSVFAIRFDVVVLVGSLAFGVVTWFALGVDFPDSNRRFARLT